MRDPADVVMLNHRNYGHLMAVGSDPQQLYRDLMGRDNAVARGRAGSVHLADPLKGVPYTSAMLGGGAAVDARLISTAAAPAPFATTLLDHVVPTESRITVAIRELIDRPASP